MAQCLLLTRETQVYCQSVASFLLLYYARLHVPRACAKHRPTDHLIKMIKTGVSSQLWNINTLVSKSLKNNSVFMFLEELLISPNE